MVNMSSTTGVNGFTAGFIGSGDGNAIRAQVHGNLKARLPGFAADWGRLRPTNPRFADGCALLNKLNPRRPDSARNTIEVRAHIDHTLPVQSEVEALIDAELDNLEPERCMVSPRDDGSTLTVGEVHDALAHGEPLLIGVHTPLADGGLGALPQLPTALQPGSRALVYGSGAIARTCTSARAPVVTRQLAGQALLVFWPESQANRTALHGAASLRHVISRLDRLDGVRTVVLRAGETHAMPAGARYVTLALGDGRSTFAVQMKYTLAKDADNTIAITGKRSRAEEEGDACEQCRKDGVLKRVKLEDM
ncbi:hypothetical protein EXIGLDRAFT_833467 [Exidia glandulosa HHB12029]|uniref:Uncharacterized protein n=1 Tax=Exidia glandulosa HHB12029 TaxID=1314781 RepID=A0A165KNN0_EXIGL|nr:hypothetical protein EXIGLDRAFT_833467 [Exidia glandulosa HHB12029]